MVGKFKELYTIGIGHDVAEIEALCAKGQKWIKNHIGMLELDFEGPAIKEQEVKAAETVLNNIDSILLNGAKLILDKVYDSIGFNNISDDVLRHLVVARLCQPMSKMATVDYLKSYFDEDLNLSKIYRYLDKLYNTQQETIQELSVEHTFSVLGGRVEMLFYDVTSLYFESMDMSVDTVIKIAKTITTIRLRLPLNEKIITKTMLLTPEHRSLKPLFDYLKV